MVSFRIILRNAYIGIILNTMFAYKTQIHFSEGLLIKVIQELIQTIKALRLEVEGEVSKSSFVLGLSVILHPSCPVLSFYIILVFPHAFCIG